MLVTASFRDSLMAPAMPSHLWTSSACGLSVPPLPFGVLPGSHLGQLGLPLRLLGQILLVRPVGAGLVSEVCLAEHLERDQRVADLQRLFSVGALDLAAGESDEK